MIVVVCLDDRDGMSFLKRRQSQDSGLRNHLLEVSRGSGLWMNSYSARQFEEKADNIRVDENFLELAEPGDYCFLETGDVELACRRAEKLVIYRWNRHYPSDVKFPMELFADRMRLLSREEFAGSSHEKISCEVYAL